MELLKELFGELVSEVVAPILLALVLLPAVLVIYFIMKKVSGSKTTFQEDLWQAHFSQGQAAPQTPFVKELAGLRTGLETALLYLIYGVIALVTGFIIYFFATLRDDANKGNKSLDSHGSDTIEGGSGFRVSFSIGRCCQKCPSASCLLSPVGPWLVSSLGSFSEWGSVL